MNRRHAVVRSKPTTSPMATRVKLIFGTLIAAIAVATVVFFAAFLSDTFNLACNMAGPSSGPQRYAFHIKIPKFFGQPHVAWVGTNTHDLRIVRSDDTMIIADLDQRLVTEAGTPVTTAWFLRMVQRTGKAAK